MAEAPAGNRASRRAPPRASQQLEDGQDRRVTTHPCDGLPEPPDGGVRMTPVGVDPAITGESPEESVSAPAARD